MKTTFRDLDCLRRQVQDSDIAETQVQQIINERGFTAADVDDRILLRNAGAPYELKRYAQVREVPAQLRRLLR